MTAPALIAEGDAATQLSSPPNKEFELPLALNLALRDLRGGLSGLLLLVVCVALGTAAIGTIGSLSSAIEEALLRDGKVLLGGDAEASLVHRQATAEERVYLGLRGVVSEVATLRAMGRVKDTDAQALIDVKAVDGAFPLYGAVGMEGASQFDGAIGDGGGVAVDASLLSQLGIHEGETIEIGRASFPVKGVVGQEPDRLAGGPALGARVFMSLASLEKTGLIEPGSLVRWSYRIRGDGLRSEPLRDALLAKFPEAGFQVRDSSDPSPGVSATIERLTEFLTLAGLTAMLTGGIGVANAVSAFLDRRRTTVAIYKALGASQRTVFWVLFFEIAILVLCGVAIGIVFAAVVPTLAAHALSGAVPIEIRPGIYSEALGLAALFGVLSALPFIFWPLGRAGEIRGAELLRGESGSRAFPPPLARAASFLAVVALAAAAIGLSHEPRVAAFACAGLFVLFAVFWGAGIAIRELGRRLPRSENASLTLALVNLGGPASVARTVALSLGTGLTLLTAVSVIDASLNSELRSHLPEHAPSYFFIGIPKPDIDVFRGVVARSAPEARVTSAPMLRGRIVALRGIPVEAVKAPANVEWVVNGDRGLTYAENLPSGSEVVSGQWWRPMYEGEPLVSFEADIGKALGLRVGDAVTVNVLGRNVTAKIANFRTVKWGSIDINFVMIFSPNALKAAPFTYLATLSLPDGAAGDNAGQAILKQTASAFPSVSAIKVKDALAAIDGILGKVIRGIEIAGGVTVVMGGIVVAGALLTAQRRRVYEAVVLRTLGASRKRIVTAHLIEYLIIAGCLSLLAAALGLLAAYLAITQLMGLGFDATVTSLLQPSLLEAIFVVGLGLLGTLRVLSVKPARYLRSL